MKILGVDHITINVISMEKSIYFYEKVLGLTKEECIDMGDHFIQYFKFPDQNILELIKYKYETGMNATPVDTKSIYRHIAMKVDNLDEIYNIIQQEKEIEIHMKPAFCNKLNFRNILIKDPNGVEIEILERKNER